MEIRNLPSPRSARVAETIIFRLLLFALTWTTGAFAAGEADICVSYTNEIVASVPWSIHIVKIDRARQDVRFTTALGGGNVLGMGIVSDQVKSLPAGAGMPLAAINGDF